MPIQNTLILIHFDEGTLFLFFGADPLIYPKAFVEGDVFPPYKRLENGSSIGHVTVRARLIDDNSLNGL